MTEYPEYELLAEELLRMRGGYVQRNAGHLVERIDTLLRVLAEHVRDADAPRAGRVH